MTTVPDPWIIDTTPATLAGWLGDWLRGMTFRVGVETDAGGAFEFAGCFPKLDDAGVLTATGVCNVHQFKPERPDADFVTWPFNTFYIRALPLDTTRTELSIRVLDPRVEPLVHELCAAIAQRWPPPDVAADADSIEARVRANVMASIEPVLKSTKSPARRRKPGGGRTPDYSPEQKADYLAQALKYKTPGRSWPMVADLMGLSEGRLKRLRGETRKRQLTGSN